MYEHYKLTCLSKSKVGELYIAFVQECGLNFSWLPKLLSFLYILNTVIPSFFLRKQNLLKQSSYNTCMVFFLNANFKSLCKLVNCVLSNWSYENLHCKRNAYVSVIPGHLCSCLHHWHNCVNMVSILGALDLAASV